MFGYDAAGSRGGDPAEIYYAFVITPEPFTKSLQQSAVEVTTSSIWDFAIFPNPTRDMIMLRFEDDAIKEVALLDVSGRHVARYTTTTSPLMQIPTDGLAKGAYWVLVSTGDQSKTKKLIIH